MVACKDCALLTVLQLTAWKERRRDSVFVTVMCVVSAPRRGTTSRGGSVLPGSACWGRGTSRPSPTAQGEITAADSSTQRSKQMARRKWQRLGNVCSFILPAHYCAVNKTWLGSRVVSVLDSGAEGPGFKSQPRCCRVTVLGKLFTPIVPPFTKQRNC